MLLIRCEANKIRFTFTRTAPRTAFHSAMAHEDIATLFDSNINEGGERAERAYDDISAWLKEAAARTEASERGVAAAVADARKSRPTDAVFQDMAVATAADVVKPGKLLSDCVVDVLLRYAGDQGLCKAQCMPCAMAAKIFDGTAGTYTQWAGRHLYDAAKLVLVPVFTGSRHSGHWSLAAVYRAAGAIVHYDSCGNMPLPQQLPPPCSVVSSQWVTFSVWSRVKARRSAPCKSRPRSSARRILPYCRADILT